MAGESQWLHLGDTVDREYPWLHLWDTVGGR